jgi:hypothetical protein
MNRPQFEKWIGKGLLAVIVLGVCPANHSSAQSPTSGGRGPGRGTAPAYQPEATLGQLMKGILYPASNVIFSAQSDNPANAPTPKDPSVATDPLQNSYGKWEAVENSSLAIAEAANLLMIPGRKCSNGKPVPLGNANWAVFVQGVRDAGMKAYKAAQSKDQDKILDAADTMTTACANCHDKYREKATPADRCM